jgi:CheY-like chemotaxis protein
MRQMGATDLLIIGCTGQALEDDVEAFKAAGADNVAIKPISVDAIARACNAHQKGARGRRDTGSSASDVAGAAKGADASAGAAEVPS